MIQSTIFEAYAPNQCALLKNTCYGGVAARLGGTQNGNGPNYQDRALHGIHLAAILAANLALDVPTLCAHFLLAFPCHGQIYLNAIWARLSRINTTKILSTYRDDQSGHRADSKRYKRARLCTGSLWIGASPGANLTRRPITSLAIRSREPKLNAFLFIDPRTSESVPDLTAVDSDVSLRIISLLSPFGDESGLRCLFPNLPQRVHIQFCRISSCDLFNFNLGPRVSQLLSACSSMLLLISSASAPVYLQGSLVNL